MKKRIFLSLSASFVLGLAISVSTASISVAQTTLRIFTGGQQRPDVMRKIAVTTKSARPA